MPQKLHKKLVKNEPHYFSHFAVQSERNKALNNISCKKHF
ncbi:hypothetical protein HMPREF9996_01171 [Aggregatibacter actinomycetemcomitans Y4]|nr:hypothetical protein HMPREF9996_01171 [Aggregatibacter actinomycetemcomitans Y4]